MQYVPLPVPRTYKVTDVKSFIDLKKKSLNYCPLKNLKNALSLQLCILVYTADKMTGKGWTDCIFLNWRTGYNNRIFHSIESERKMIAHRAALGTMLFLTVHEWPAWVHQFLHVTICWWCKAIKGIDWGRGLLKSVRWHGWRARMSQSMAPWVQPW